MVDEREKKKEEEAMIEEEIEHPFFSNDNKLNMWILESNTDLIRDNNIYQRAYAIIRRGYMPDGTPHIDISVHNSFRFKMAMRSFAKKTGLFIKKNGVWVLNKEKIRENREYLFDVLNFLRKYVKDIFVQGQIYNEIYNEVQRIVIPRDPLNVPKTPDEKLMQTIQKKSSVERDRNTPLKKGDKINIIPATEKYPTLTQTIESMKEEMNKLRGMVEKLYAINGLLNNPKILVIPTNRYMDTMKKLREMGAEPTGYGLQLTDRENELNKNIEDIKRTMGEDVPEINTGAERIHELGDVEVER